MSATTSSSSSTESKVVPWSNLGSSGLKISQFILGCMQFGSKEWWNWVEDDEEKIFAILKTAYDLGIRTFDTANCYSNGLSEILIGKFLKKYNIKRDKVVIMTKLCVAMDESYGPTFMFAALDHLPQATQIDFANNKGLSRKHIIDSVEGSMKRLGTYIDVLQIHRYDHSTPPAETMKALNDVIEKGDVRYIGASSMRAVEFVELQHIAEKNGWAKFINMQSSYNLLRREDEHELNYYCDKHGVGLTPYSPIARGALAKPLRPADGSLSTREEAFSTIFKKVTLEDKGSAEYGADAEIISRVEELAVKKNTTMSSVSLAWLVAKGAHPIVGVNSEARLYDLIAAAELELSDEEIKFLEEPYRPKLRTFS